MLFKGLIIYLLPLLLQVTKGGSPEEEQGVRYANRCEACKILAAELEARLGETGKSHDVIEIGYSVDDVKPKKRTEYRRSELRLLESLENVCERVLEYNLHKERTDSTRFAKGMSQTFQTLHGLVDKGVKVDLGIPYELWDKPPVEVTQMKTQCENMLEEYEERISDWYFKLQDKKSLKKHLCEDHVLKKKEERECLKEELPPTKPKKKNVKKNQKAKGDKEEL
ncbi:hypothetical protein KR054_004927 [Drosophila jambulina]|nr:hypothetical protein KR054_004927 [Drosophila jambulina]